MAEMRGGPMAHQLPLHNHRGGLVQPSLVINQNNMDYRYCHDKISTFGWSDIKLIIIILLKFLKFQKF